MKMVAGNASIAQAKALNLNTTSVMEKTSKEKPLIKTSKSVTKGISFDKLNVPTIPGFLPLINNSSSQIDLKKPLKSPY